MSWFTGVIVSVLALSISFCAYAGDIEMMHVKGGCFEMGDTFLDGDSNEKPVHNICVDDFYIGKFEVTQRQ